MGKIIRNGIEFSSTSDTANNINYDNTLSGLNAVTAQEAIDELNENVDTLTESLENIGEPTLIASGTGDFTVDITPYKFLLLVSYNNGNGNLTGSGLYPKNLIKSNMTIYSFIAATNNVCNAIFNSLTSIKMESDYSGGNIIPKLYGIK